MTREEFRKLTSSQNVFLDGATGSNLRRAGMPVGICTEKWILEHPDPLNVLQAAYADAGTMIMYAPTFSANRISLANYGCEDMLEELNRRLFSLTRKNVGDRCIVAADMTTLGKPVGEGDGCISYDLLYDTYREQASILADEGAELFVLETMMGVTECTAGIEAIRSLGDYPVMCSLSFDSVGGCFFDGDAVTAAQTLPAVGADALGLNCGSGPDLCESVIRTIRDNCGVPVICKPNAGLPEMQSDGTAVYAMTPTRFARHMANLKQAGAGLLGGCCGTTPEHIKALTEMCR